MTNHAVHLAIPVDDRGATRSFYGVFQDPAGHSLEITSFCDKSNVIAK